MRHGEDGEIEFAASIRTDWVDQKYACGLQSSRESGVMQGELIHKPGAVEAWADIRLPSHSSNRVDRFSLCFSSMSDVPRFTQPFVIEDFSTSANSLGVR
jgi:hypothetical protein